jgi:hypothetical protein
MAGKVPAMNNYSDEAEQMAVLAVLSAAAREAEELLAQDPDLDRGAIDEANRRLKQFLRTARQIAR